MVRCNKSRAPEDAPVHPRPSKETAIGAEVQWGLDYRERKKEEPRPSISPVSSPINYRDLWHDYQTGRNLQTLRRIEKGLVSKAPKPPLKLNPDKNPQLANIAKPNKRQVLNTWKLYGHVLPMEMLENLDQALDDDGTLDPAHLKEYFKILDYRKKKNTFKRKIAFR